MTGGTTQGRHVDDIERKPGRPPMRTFRTVLEQKIRERRQTFEEFAEYTESFACQHSEPGTISLRHLQRLAAGRGPNGKALGPVRPATARLLETIFGLSIDELLAPPDQGAVLTAPAHLIQTGDGLAVVCGWLDERAGWPSGTSQRQVMSQLASAITGQTLDRQSRRARATRSRVARALGDYYGDTASGARQYRARWAGRDIHTSIVTRPEWLDLSCPLTPECDRVSLVDIAPTSPASWDDHDAGPAVNRLVEFAAAGVRVANAPLYRLLEIDPKPGAIFGTVGLVPFAEYALTMDLLEVELIDALSADVPILRGGLPLRDRYLPDLASVLDLRNRLCVGGTLALCAIARPSDPYRGAADYALLVQERSGHVLNAERRLAVIPKGFHQPLEDLRADAPIGATLRREMEEELFGRVEVDNTTSESRVAAPMHPTRLSEPMRWLVEDPSRVRMECTGFGLNLVSGNYEFASLIVIDDVQFWSRFGGRIEANWESSGLHVYSSLDHELLTELVTNEAWSNEGLFAMLEGLRRLREIGGDRVKLPTIECCLAVSIR